MSGPPRVRSMNISDTESRPVLVPAGNKARTTETRKPASKPVKKTEKALQEIESKEKKPISHSISQCVSVATILRQQDHCQALRSFSMNASCSSDASSTDSSTHSRASSSGRMVRRVGVPIRKKSSSSKKEKVEKVGADNATAPDTVLKDSSDILEVKKRCAWVTPNTDPCYSAFHDEEWGVPVHDDRKLFELLSLSGALAELTWPAILSKRQIFREIFLDFDPRVVSQLNEKKISAPGSPASSLLSDLKLRAIIDNALSNVQGH
ncbi:putative DNA-3-methyladenine glycosylase [Quillaja saponaria]|uniref:DNA-3-methyladenine glycosylase n=1 Tax=Quillaja saponaria TaxID=32244 RepID=A0AAD7LTF7_QUISA|nr:putative DNA-3-methyladenine glycosylase [Quillaja saponaria]